MTTINPLSVGDWEAHFGRLYRAAIDGGVMSVMSAHIAFPAFVRSLQPDAGIEAFRPATISALLNRTLLREQLGFNGLIVSDATPMAGLGSWSSRDAYLPEIIANGCDVILFSSYPDVDAGYLRAALVDGRLTQERVDDAVERILGLKAALGLHKPHSREIDRATSTSASRAVAEDVTQRAPTLVKDVQNLLPLDPARHRRVLVITPGIVFPFTPEPIPFALLEMLRERGFAITMHEPSTEVTAAHFDLVLYLFGDETLLTRNRIFIDWLKIGGQFGKAMQRYWHDIPTLMISFGYPYLLYDAPRVPTYINAYATTDSMQRAVVEALLGNHPWNRNSPVDPFCGLEDAQY